MKQKEEGGWKWREEIITQLWLQLRETSENDAVFFIFSDVLIPKVIIT